VPGKVSADYLQERTEQLTLGEKIVSQVGGGGAAPTSLGLQIKYRQKIRKLKKIPELPKTGSMFQGFFGLSPFSFQCRDD
jgi:hypothetical protein